MFSVEEERRLLLRLADGARTNRGRAPAPTPGPLGEGAGAAGGAVSAGRAAWLAPPALPPLNLNDFQRPAHRLIWKALVALAYQGLEISPRAVAARLGGSEALAEALHILGFGG